VPIVLGTIVLSSEVGSRETIFNAVFFVVVVSALVQGTTLERVAERLGVVDAPAVAQVQPQDGAGESAAFDLMAFRVDGDHAVNGSEVRELGLPGRAFVAA